MKRIYLLMSILLSIMEVKAQQHILLQFSSQGNIPAVHYNEGSKNYRLNSIDTKLTDIFNSFSITKFTMEYPHAHLVKHPNAEALDRVYRLETSGNITQLFGKLQDLKSPAIEGPIHLLNPPQILSLPNDYGLVCGMPCGLSGCSAALENDLINAGAAWDVTTGNPNIRIAITDLNFLRTHEELVGKVVFDNAPAFDPAQPDHGTGVAALAAGNTNNNAGIASIGYNCKMDFYDYLSYDAILEAAMNGARVINCSWNDGACIPINSRQLLIDMVYDIYRAVIVAGAGNGTPHCNGGEVYPASYNHVISVTSVGHLAEPGTCNYEWKDVHDIFPGLPAFTYTHNSKVDLCAPGYRVFTASDSTDNSYVSSFGTSFAAPVVSGTAALILSVNPNLGPNDVEAILKCAARDVYEIPDNISYLNKLGAGRLNAGLAVQMAQSWVPGSGTQQAAPTNIRWFDILSNGINTIEVEDNCNSNNYPGMCNTGYRLQVVSGNPGASFKWLVFYSENGTNVSNSIKYGSSITLQRGVDYPANNVTGGNLKVCVRINDCIPGTYYAEDRDTGCFGPQCIIACPGNIIITGNYAIPLTESATWIKSSGQTIIDATGSVKLDANPDNGYIEMKPVSAEDYFLSSPGATGVFIADAYNGCAPGAPTFAGQNTNATIPKNAGELTGNTGITIYPNPGSGLFYVRHPAQIKQIVISDTYGKLILKIENRGLALTSINLSNMPPGLYILQMEGVNKIMKIIKQ